MRSHEALREALFSFSTLAESLAVAPAKLQRWLMLAAQPAGAFLGLHFEAVTRERPERLARTPSSDADSVAGRSCFFPFRLTWTFRIAFLATPRDLPHLPKFDRLP